MDPSTDSLSGDQPTSDSRRHFLAVSGSLIGSSAGCLDASNGAETPTVSGAKATPTLTGSFEGDRPPGSRIDATDTRTTRIVDVTSVIDGDTVDVGFDEHHPKEPAAYFHDGTWYVACAVWQSYDHDEVDTKEIVLCRSDRPDGGFEQVSQVTDDPGIFDHAPALHVTPDGECWIFWSNYRTGSVTARHAPVTDLPPNPGGWTDEETVIPDHKDPGLHTGSDGTIYCFANSLERPPDHGWEIYRWESTNLRDWSNRELVYEQPLRGDAAEAADVVPKADGSGWWLTYAMNERGGPGWGTWAADASSLTGQFEGMSLVTRSSDANGIQESFNTHWNSHLDYVKTDGSRSAVHVGPDLAAYEEVGDGSQYGIAFVRIRDPIGSWFHPPLEDAVGVYPFDESTGSTLRNLVDGGTAGTLDSGSWVTGYSGPGVHFDPADETVVSLDGSASIDGTITSLLVVSFEDVDNQEHDAPYWIASSGYDGRYASWEWKVLGSQLKFGSFDREAEESNVAAFLPKQFLYDDSRHVLVGRWDGSNWDIFLEGRKMPVLERGEATGALPSEGRAMLGAHDNDGETIGHFPGTVEYFGLWDRALSDEAIGHLVDGFDELSTPYLTRPDDRT
jgi:hypothetical protein